MGQGSSLDQSLEASKDRLQKGLVQAHISLLGRLATLTYAEFVKSLGELNDITKSFTDCRGMQIHFVEKKGTADTFLWKVTIRIQCCQYDTKGMRLIDRRLLTLRQFALLHVHILEVCKAILKLQSGNPNEALPCIKEVNLERANEGDENECCICMERGAEVLLACGHKFCEICIDTWTREQRHGNCPLCRGRVVGSDDTWVLADKLNSSEYAEDLKRYLVGLADEH